LPTKSKTAKKARRNMIERCPLPCCEGCELYDDHPQLTHCLQIGRCRRAFEAGQNARAGWVSVSEGLPEYEKPVNIIWGRQVKKAWLTADGIWHEVQSRFADCVLVENALAKVTHWTEIPTLPPLPAPPT
jgi:hypothetical protein